MHYETEARETVAGNDNSNHLSAARVLAYDYTSHEHPSRASSGSADKLDPTAMQNTLDSGTHSTADIYKPGGRAPSGRPGGGCDVIVDGPGPGPCKVPNTDAMPKDSGVPHAPVDVSTMPRDSGRPHPPVEIPTQRQSPVIVSDR